MNSFFACLCSGKKSKLQAGGQSTPQLRLGNCANRLRPTKTFDQRSKKPKPPTQTQARALQRSRTQEYKAERQALQTYVFPRQL